MDLEILRAMLPKEEVVAEYRRLFETVIEWHCEGRHGVVRNIDIRDPKTRTIQDMLIYHFGSKCFWMKKIQGSIYDLEFVHMAKVYPPPKKPWEWCGTSVLFADWQQKEQIQRNAAQQFRIGDTVSFFHKGKKLTGIVSNVNKRITVIVDHAKWYVPATQLGKGLSAPENRSDLNSLL